MTVCVCLCVGVCMCVCVCVCCASPKLCSYVIMYVEARLYVVNSDEFSKWDMVELQKKTCLQK